MLMDSLPLSLYAAGDLYGKTWLFGKMTSTGVTQCTVAGEKSDFVIGEVLYAKAGVQVAGDGQTVYNDRIFPIVAGGSFNPGDELTTNTSGQAVAAGASDYVNAIALEAGAAGRLVAVMRPVAKPGTSSTSKLSTYASGGGAISPTDRTSLITADGSAFTLANGIKQGDKMEIVCVGASGDSTLTIATPDTQTPAVVHYHAVDQKLSLVWTGSAWRMTDKRRAGSLTVVVGTTVLTGYELTSVFNLSVTGTVSSTGTKALPNGRFDGEKMEVRVTVAASTPVGNIDVNAKTAAAANTTHATAISATSAYSVALWSDGDQAWVRQADTGITFN
jgi:hypothetical protein